MKYFGNCAEGNEPFYEFKDLRVFDRLLTSAEIDILSHPRVVKDGVCASLNPKIFSFENNLEAVISKDDLFEFFMLIAISSGGSLSGVCDLLTILYRNSKLDFY